MYVYIYHRYPPFELPAARDHAAGTTHWFDGAVLANYLVSSANFVHPVTHTHTHTHSLTLTHSHTHTLTHYLVSSANFVHPVSE